MSGLMQAGSLHFRSDVRVVMMRNTYNMDYYCGFVLYMDFREGAF
jgi:hypothetical protein